MTIIDTPNITAILIAKSVYADIGSILYEGVVMSAMTAPTPATIARASRRISRNCMSKS